MKIELCGHDRYYDICQEAKQFFLLEPFEQGEISDADLSYIRSRADGETAIAEVSVDGQKARAALSTGGDMGYRLMMSLYLALQEATGKKLPWGSLCGVRPAKRALLQLQQGVPQSQVLEEYRRFDVSPEKALLALRVAQQEMKILNVKRENGISLYISIPFCPSRCAYCSFYAAERPRSGTLVQQYLQALLQEMQAVGRMLRQTGQQVQTVYVGGGTPSVLTEGELSLLLGGLSTAFDLTGLLELTVECGRPDTVTSQKLETLRRAGVTRISLNPQTMQDKTLQAIGRAHTAAQFLESFDLALAAGFSHINCDLIAGLPGETQQDFFHSLERICALGAANITVHTLSVKRSSVLFDHTEAYGLTQGREVRAMVDGAFDMLSERGYEPYYLYRQKNMLGNLENVGYTKEGAACAYNVFMMEEQQPVLGLGAGSSSVLPDVDGRVRRAFNVKQPEDYIARLSEMICRKEALLGLGGEQAETGR